MKMKMIILVAGLVVFNAAGPSTAHAMGKRRIVQKTPDLLCGKSIYEQKAVNGVMYQLNQEQILQMPVIADEIRYTSWSQNAPRDLLAYNGGESCAPDKKFAAFYGGIAQHLKNDYARSRDIDASSVRCTLQTSVGVLHFEDPSWSCGLRFQDVAVSFRCYQIVDKSLDEIRKEFCDLSQVCTFSQRDADIRKLMNKERALYCNGSLGELLSDLEKANASVATNSSKRVQESAETSVADGEKGTTAAAIASPAK